MGLKEEAKPWDLGTKQGRHCSTAFNTPNLRFVVLHAVSHGPGPGRPAQDFPEKLEASGSRSAGCSAGRAGGADSKESKMGQRTTQAQRQELLRNPLVADVTEHVWLKDNTMVDPADFIVEKRLAVLVMKLLKCTCNPMIHQAGTHLVVTGTSSRTVLRRRWCSDSLEKWVCPGEWTCEEIIDDPQERRRRLPLVAIGLAALAGKRHRE